MARPMYCIFPSPWDSTCPNSNESCHRVKSIERKAVRGLIPQRQFESLQSATSGLWEQQSGVDSARLQEPLYSAPVEPSVGLPVGEQIHILAGSSRKYVDHAGKLWSPDSYFSGGTAVSSAVRHIWRTQDPIIYRNSRQGDFSYNIPLKPGIYELRLHFAETFYGPEDPGGGGEGSRIMAVTANGKPLLTDFDVIADSAG